jgi:hypothetical protein
VTEEYDCSPEMSPRLAERERIRQKNWNMVTPVDSSY